MSVISANSVYKSYPGVEALKNFSIEVQRGECFALLGKNGAGKTTFIKSLLSLVSYDSGSLKLFDEDVSNKSARQKVSYLPEKFNFYPYYTLEAVAMFYAGMKSVNKDIDKNRNDVKSSLSRLGIGDLAKKKVKECSKGQLQRLGIACSLLGNSELLILDEPFSGLDPIGIKELQGLLKELSDEGRTIFINSHGLDSIEKICKSVAIIDKGSLLKSGPIKELVGQKSLLDYFYDVVGGVSHE